jgi:hypothetical protein
MKHLLPLFILLISSCNQPNKYHKAENALDAGREFINALLKDDFKTAAFYIIPNDENNRLLSQFERKYNKQSAEVKKQYQQAVINIFEVVDVNGIETIISYSNSYDKTRHKLKVLKVHGDWLIDIKYSFEGSV